MVTTATYMCEFVHYGRPIHQGITAYLTNHQRSHICPENTHAIRRPIVWFYIALLCFYTQRNNTRGDHSNIYAYCSPSCNSSCESQTVGILFDYNVVISNKFLFYEEGLQRSHLPPASKQKKKQLHCRPDKHAWVSGFGNCSKMFLCRLGVILHLTDPLQVLFHGFQSAFETEVVRVFLLLFIVIVAISFSLVWLLSGFRSLFYILSN